MIEATSHANNTWNDAIPADPMEMDDMSLQNGNFNMSMIDRMQRFVQNQYEENDDDNNSAWIRQNLLNHQNASSSRTPVDTPSSMIQPINMSSQAIRQETQRKLMGAIRMPNQGFATEVATTTPLRYVPHLVVSRADV
jgi:hypothetical protein